MIMFYYLFLIWLALLSGQQKKFLVLNKWPAIKFPIKMTNE